MRKQITIALTLCIVVLFIYIFAQYKTQNKDSGAKYGKYANYGGIQLNLPKIAGMTECYSVPFFKEIIDENLAESDGICTLACYLPNPICKEIEILDEIPFDGSIFVEAYEDMKNMKWHNLNLDKTAQIMTENIFNKIEWNPDDATIEDKLVHIIGLETGTAVLLESYAPDNNARAVIGLVYLPDGSEDHLFIMIMNAMTIKERLIVSTGYYKYEDENSLMKAKAKNDYFLLRFLEENP
ncbi:MAG: hypothetical protein FWF52_00925 [Candidatus Azobacteroides sp.]|nr:hypothetical protein [Candidatus Azobacteroides sp.]